MTENDKRCPNCACILDLERPIWLGYTQHYCECGNRYVIRLNVGVYTGDLEVNGELHHLFYVPLYSCLKCRRVIGEWTIRCIPSEEAMQIYLEMQEQLQQYTI